MIEKSKHSIFEHILNFFSGGKRDLWHKPVPISPNYQVYTTRFDRVCDSKELETALGKPSRDAEDAFMAARAMFEFSISTLRQIEEIKIARILIEFSSLMPTNQKTIVSFLVDHSGSMRGKNILTAMTICAIWGKILSDAGASVEVLGFTTSSWRGGRSHELWLENGKADHPGRLCDLLHVIHRSANEDCVWNDDNLNTMLTPNLLKENVDGEAIIWAERRLLEYIDTNRILIVLSDGAPVDDNTLINNKDERILFYHLNQEVNRIQEEKMINIIGIGINHTVDRTYSNHTCVDGPNCLSHIEPLIAKALMGPATAAPPPA